MGGPPAPRVPRVQLVAALHVTTAACVPTTSMTSVLGPRKKGRNSVVSLAADLAAMTSASNENVRMRRKSSARFQSSGEQTPSSAGPPVPAVNHPSFPVKLDVNLTVESLCTAGLHLAAAHARDSGVIFNPPSPRPEDYALRLCAGEAATVFLSDPLVPASHGGDTLRRQIAAAVGEKSLSVAGPLMYVAMIPSQEWVDRHAIESGEAKKREAFMFYYSEAMENAKALAEVSVKKAEAMRIHRARHEVMIADMEAALFNALAVVNTAGHALQAVRDRLTAAEADWANAEEEREQWARKLFLTKREFYNNSMNASKTDALAKHLSQS